MTDTLSRLTSTFIKGAKGARHVLSSMIDTFAKSESGSIHDPEIHNGTRHEPVRGSFAQLDQKAPLDGFVVPRNAFQGQYFVCVGDLYCPCHDIMAWAKPVGAAAVFGRSLMQALDMVQTDQQDIGALFVCVDDCDDLALSLDTLVEFRRNFNSPPVLLMSHDFALNDFSTERLAVCDASLRLPLSRTSFGLGLSSALGNNETQNLNRALPLAVAV